MNLLKLAEPFPADEIEWRVQRAGTKRDGGVWAAVVPYVNNRAIMHRLDEVVGPHLWRNEFRYEQGGAVLCGLSVKVGDEWVTKWDGAENTDIEKVKGGLSNAMKRAAVQWGIGRYLSGTGEMFAIIVDDSDRSAKYQPGKPDSGQKKGYPAFKWRPPILPAHMLPKAEVKAAAHTDAPKESPRVPTGKPGAVNLVTLGEITLPGSKTALMGYGGKRIADVPRESLPAIREKLDGFAQYEGVRLAIDEYLELTRGE